MKEAGGLFTRWYAQYLLEYLIALLLFVPAQGGVLLHPLLRVPGNFCSKPFSCRGKGRGHGGCGRHRAVAGSTEGYCRGDGNAARD